VGNVEWHKIYTTQTHTHTRAHTQTHTHTHTQNIGDTLANLMHHNPIPVENTEPKSSHVRL